MYIKKTSLISRPLTSNLDGLGGGWDTFKSGVSGAIDFFGAGLKAQGAQQALAQQLALQQAAQQPKGDSGISTTTLVIGGVAVAGLLVFMMRRK
jgi:hypothetical protein